VARPRSRLNSSTQCNNLQPSSPRHPDFATDLPYVIHVAGGTRVGRVLRTVAHVAIDEEPDGTPVMARWDIKQHRAYPA